MKAALLSATVWVILAPALRSPVNSRGELMALIAYQLSLLAPGFVFRGMEL